MQRFQSIICNFRLRKLYESFSRNMITYLHQYNNRLACNCGKKNHCSHFNIRLHFSCIFIPLHQHIMASLRLNADHSLSPRYGPIGLPSTTPYIAAVAGTAASVTAAAAAAAERNAAATSRNIHRGRRPGPGGTAMIYVCACINCRLCKRSGQRRAGARFVHELASGSCVCVYFVSAQNACARSLCCVHDVVRSYLCATSWRLCVRPSTGPTAATKVWNARCVRRTFVRSLSVSPSVALRTL